jgi:hypothetical protein
MVGGDGLEVLTGGGIRLSSAGSGPLAAGSVNPWAAAAGLALVCPGDGGRRGIGNWGQAPSARASLSSMAWRAKRRWLPATGAPEVGLLGSDSLGLIRPAMAVGVARWPPRPPEDDPSAAIEGRIAGLHVPLADQEPLGRLRHASQSDRHIVRRPYPSGGDGDCRCLDGGSSTTTTLRARS